MNIVEVEPNDFEKNINQITEQFMSLLDSNDVIENTPNQTFESIQQQPASSTWNRPALFKFEPDIRSKDSFQASTPAYAIQFASSDQKILNETLESLYQQKKQATVVGNPNIAFSDANLRAMRERRIAQEKESMTTDSSYENKEVLNMANGNKENAFYRFATIPKEQALVPQRTWKETLTMDIPWDTKIDLWGNFKEFCRTQVKFTF